MDTGLNLFDLKSTCDTDKLEDNILAIEGIASVSVQLDGVRLMVYISEELPPPVIENRDVYEPIIAEYDSIITRLIVLSGTALVEVGDTVYKGQVLIAPYMSDGNTLDPSIQEKREKIYADGQIYGRIWLSKSAVINDEKLVTVRTGEFVQEVNVHYLLDFNSKISVPYLEYEKEIKITQLNAVFPLNIAYTTYYETKQQLQPCNIEVETNNAIALSYLKLTEIAQGQILRQWHTIKKTDNGTIIEVVAETIQRIDGG